MTRDEACALFVALSDAFFSCEVACSVVGTIVDPEGRERVYLVSVTTPALTLERLTVLAQIADAFGCELNMATSVGQIALAPKR